MAPRTTARRLLVAAPAVALVALAATACHPPHEKASDEPNADYTLPSFTVAPEPSAEKTAARTPAATSTPAVAPVPGANAETPAGPNAAPAN